MADQTATQPTPSLPTGIVVIPDAQGVKHTFDLAKLDESSGGVNAKNLWN